MEIVEKFKENSKIIRVVEENSNVNFMEVNFSLLKNDHTTGFFERLTPVLPTTWRRIYKTGFLRRFIPAVPRPTVEKVK